MYTHKLQRRFEIIGEYENDERKEHECKFPSGWRTYPASRRRHASRTRQTKIVLHVQDLFPGEQGTFWNANVKMTSVGVLEEPNCSRQSAKTSQDSLSATVAAPALRDNYLQFL